MMKIYGTLKYINHFLKKKNNFSFSYYNKKIYLEERKIKNIERFFQENI